MTLELRPVTAALGAEAFGIDLNGALAEDECDRLRRALNAHLVLFFRAQHVDDAAHLALARVFGEPLVHPFERAMGRSDPLHSIVDRADTEPDRAGWHSDDTYLAQPPSVAVLRCEVAPEFGGDTAWANMCLAYERLSVGMQTYLSGLHGLHETSGSLREYVEKHLPADAARAALELVGPGVAHPIVRTHPESARKAVFLEPSFMTRIVDLPAEESRFVCSFLGRLMDDVSIQCRFRWRAGDIAIWDERVTQHIGAADHRGSRRVLRRCTVAGERPA